MPAVLWLKLRQSVLSRSLFANRSYDFDISGSGGLAFSLITDDISCELSLLEELLQVSLSWLHIADWLVLGKKLFDLFSITFCDTHFSVGQFSFLTQEFEPLVEIVIDEKGVFRDQRGRIHHNVALMVQNGNELSFVWP